MPQPSSPPAMLTFQVSVHARPTSATPGGEIEASGDRHRTLVVSPDAMATPFDVDFEQTAQSLQELERMYVEPDGSFVWTSSHDGAPWQVDGNLFDRAGKLLFVDLKGSCPADQLNRLLSAFGWPATPLMFQLTRQAVFLGEDEFRRFAAEKASAPRDS